MNSSLKTEWKRPMGKMLIIGILFLTSLSTFANEVETLNKEQSEAIHNDLRKLKDTMERAMNENDVDALLANVDEKVVFSTMNGDVVSGRENLRSYYTKMMSGPDKVIDSISSKFVADELSLLIENDVAIAHGHSDSKYKLAVGKELDVTAIWSTTMINREGKWKIANFHYSVNMFDNPIIAAQSKLLWIVGIGGGILTVIAFIIGRRRKK